MFTSEGSSCSNNRHLTGDMQQDLSLRETWRTLHFLFIDDRPRKLKTFETVARPPSIARKPRTDAQLIASALLLFHRRKWKISFVRRTAFVLALKHPLKWNQVRFYFLNSPQVQRFLDKSDKSPIR